jgi:putative endonuclease
VSRCGERNPVSEGYNLLDSPGWECCDSLNWFNAENHSCVGRNPVPEVYNLLDSRIRENDLVVSISSMIRIIPSQAPCLDVAREIQVKSSFMLNKLDSFSGQKIIKSRRMDNFYVYIMASQRNGTLYIGLTNELERRVSEHKDKILDGFTARYNVDQLVYYETFETYSEAFERERRLKKWKRDWKLKLIESENPEWKDLPAG